MVLSRNVLIDGGYLSQETQAKPPYEKISEVKERRNCNGKKEEEEGYRRWV